MSAPMERRDEILQRLLLEEPDPLAAFARSELAGDATARAELVALKSAFLQIASHELRTPLTPLHLLLRQAATRVARDEKIEPEMIARMQRQTHRLTALVNELVDLVRLEHGRVGVDYQNGVRNHSSAYLPQGVTDRRRSKISLNDVFPETPPQPPGAGRNGNGLRRRVRAEYSAPAGRS